MAFNDTSDKSRMTIWLFAASISVVTTRHLLDHELHFPMHLLSLQLFSALVLDLIRRLFNRSDRPAEGAPWGYSDFLRRLPYTVCYAGTLVCGYQAMHHWHTLPVAMMVLGLDWRPIWTVACKTSTERSIRQLVTQVVLLSFGMILMILLDFRPTTVGIVMLLLAATFTAVADLFELGKGESLTQEIDSRLTPGTTDLLGALVLALFWCLFREQQFFDIRPYSPWASDLPTLALNLICSTLAFNIAGHLFRYSPTSQEQPITRLALPMSFVCLVTIANSWSSVIPPLISPWQLIGFGGVILALLPIQSQQICIDTCPDSKDGACRICCSEDTSKANSGRRRIESYLGLFILLVLLALSVVLAKALGGESGQTAPITAVLEDKFQPTHSLDIVIARYDEPASEVARHLNELHSLTAVQSLEPSIIVYDKSEDFNSSSLLSELNRLVVPSLGDISLFHLKNIGRETDTYLEHITSHWDDLAAHTLFMQASPHNAPRAYLRRIRDYFVPETGFLSLADSKRFCSACDECHDRDWSESPSVINSVFDDFNHGAPCADMVLTYRGQFIASAARIRGNPLESYQRWLYELRSPESFLHSPPYIEDVFSRKNDSMSAPRVGFTLERMWGTMMQCNGRGIATQCPTLLRSALCPTAVCGRAALGSCQCLDE